MTLSERLTAVARMVTTGLTVADVGCDHGYLAIHLINKGIAPHVIAMDINKGPLEHATLHVTEAGLSERIDLRLSDGLEALDKGEADCVVMAGMGGRLMTDIMTKGSEVLSGVRELIMQPQSDIEYVRRHLEDNGYRIISEDIVFEDGKFYPMMKVIHGEMKLGKDVYYKFGKVLLHEEHQILRQFLMQEMGRLNSVKTTLLSSPETDRVKEGLEVVSADLDAVLEALEYCNGTNPVTIERVIK